MCGLFRNIFSRLTCKRGATLVELMISLVIFSIGFLAIMAMCLMSIQSNALIDRMTEANLLAQDKMEELLAADSASLSTNNDIVGHYARSWVIVDDPVDPNDKWVTVTVNWSDNKGDHQMRLKSFVRER